MEKFGNWNSYHHQFLLKNTFGWSNKGENQRNSSKHPSLEKDVKMLIWMKLETDNERR